MSGSTRNPGCMGWTVHGRQALIERAAQAPSVMDVFIAASSRLQQAVPFDSAVWLATDPATGLPTAPALNVNMAHANDPGTCSRVWELEFLVDDVNRYRDLARASRPAAGLRAATGDRPDHSARYRAILRPHGFGDELRAVLRADGAAWALFSLFREIGRTPFEPADSALVAEVCEPLADAIRDLARPVPATAPDRVGTGPGMLLFDADGHLVSLNDEAEAWIDELRGDHPEPGADGVRLPMIVLTTLMRARTQALGRARGGARARVRGAAGLVGERGGARAGVRGASGRRLVCHASCLRAADGTVAETALVLEPAAGSEIAPIIVEAYELSPRERQITQLIARGIPTEDIAATLHLSRHTVRDYIKAIFEKVGVRSRGELVALPFAEHYAPMRLDAGSVTSR